MSGIKISGAWITPARVFPKVGGEWKIAVITYAKVDGAWRITTFGAPPPKPNLSYQSNHVFQITNYSSTLVYSTNATSGSGTATLNTSTGVYSISGSTANYRFDVIARYAIGALPSDPGFMERKQHSFSCRQVTYTEAYGCNCGLVGGNCSCGPPGPSGGCEDGSSPNGQCGCGGSVPCMYGSIGTVVCQTCYREVCCSTICDVLINEPGYTNSGSAWYRAG